MDGQTTQKRCVLGNIKTAAAVGALFHYICGESSVSSVLIGTNLFCITPRKVISVPIE